MAMSSFDKDMNIIQKLNDEPNDRDGLTAGELKAKFDEGGLALKGYLNNTVLPYVNTMDETTSAHAANTSNPHSVTAAQVGLGNVPNVSTNNQTPTYTAASSNTALSSGEKLSVAFGKIAKAVSSLISHLADTTVHITASERTTWNGKFDKTGGTITGDTTIAKATPSFLLVGPEKSGVGPTRTKLIKSANTSTDYGTYLTDMTWGDGSNNQAQAYLNLCTAAAANALGNILRLYYRPGDGTTQTHTLYGTHNPPAVANVTGLQTALGNKYDKTGGTLTGNVTIQKDSLPSVVLKSAAKENVGQAQTVLQKNASATTDWGTILFDYTWGNLDYVKMYLKASAATTKELLYLYYKPESGSAVTYYLYGTHNPPGIADVTGLQTDFYVVSGKKSGTTLGTKATAEGWDTTASDLASHAEGRDTIAGAEYSHAEGYGTKTTMPYAHAEGCRTEASGTAAHAEGYYTIADRDYQHVFGQYNVTSVNSVEIVGWGTSSTRKNIRTLANNGNEWIAGTLTQASDARLKDVSGEVPDVSGIRAVKFRWNDQKGEHDEKDHIGYLAQEVEQVAPFLVGEDSSGYKSLDYIAFLCAKVEYLERRVAELEKR